MAEIARSPQVTAVLGYNLFQLNNPIKVEAGDFIGAETGNSQDINAGGAISYSLDGVETSTQCVSNLERTTWFAFITSTNFTCSSNRTYSLRAFGIGRTDD